MNSNLFPLGTVVQVRGNRDRFAYLGYNARTGLHEAAQVGQKIEAKEDRISKA